LGGVLFAGFDSFSPAVVGIKKVRLKQVLVMLVVKSWRPLRCWGVKIKLIKI